MVFLFASKIEIPEASLPWPCQLCKPPFSSPLGSSSIVGFLLFSPLTHFCQLLLGPLFPQSFYLTNPSGFSSDDLSFRKSFWARIPLPCGPLYLRHPHHCTYLSSQEFLFQCLFFPHHDIQEGRNMTNFV